MIAIRNEQGLPIEARLFVEQLPDGFDELRTQEQWDTYCNSLDQGGTN